MNEKSWIESIGGAIGWIFMMFLIILGCLLGITILGLLIRGMVFVWDGILA